MSRTSTQSSLDAQPLRIPPAEPNTQDISSGTTPECKSEEDNTIPPLQDPDYRRDSVTTLHPVDPDAWPASRSQSRLEQLNGHDLMAMFPTQAPKQLICCDAIFKSQAREFLAKQTLPSVDIQETSELVVDAIRSNPSPLSMAEEAKTYMPRSRRTSKNESYIPPLTRRPLHRN